MKRTCEIGDNCCVWCEFERKQQRERKKVVLLGTEPRASGLIPQRSQGQRFQKASDSNGPDYLSLDNLLLAFGPGSPIHRAPRAVIVLKFFQIHEENMLQLGEIAWVFGARKTRIAE